jgi:hypothetical protein
MKYILQTILVILLIFTISACDADTNEHITDKNSYTVSTSENIKEESDVSITETEIVTGSGETTQTAINEQSTSQQTSKATQPTTTKIKQTAAQTTTETTINSETSSTNENTGSVTNSGSGNVDSTGTVPDESQQTPDDSDEFENLYPAYIMEENRSLWGYLNNSGEFIIPPQYDWAEDFQENGLAVVYRANYAGLINKSDEFIVEPFYNVIYEYNDGLSIAEHNGEYRIINENGEVVFQTDGLIGEFSEGLAPFSKQLENGGYRYGYINREGIVEIEPEYKDAENFIEGLALVCINEGKYAVIDRSGNMMYQYDYAIVTQMSDDLLIFYDSDSKKYGYLYINGTIAIDPVFSNAEPFSDGLAVVTIEDDTLGQRSMLIDKEGNPVLNQECGSIYRVGSGLYAVCEKEEFDYGFNYSKKALFNNKGEQLTGFCYYSIGEFKEEIASVSDNTSTCFINKNGNKIKNLPEIDCIGEMEYLDGIIRVYVDEELIYINEEGETVWKSLSTFKFDNGIIVEQVKYRPDIFTLVYYPQITGHTDTDMETGINNNLKSIFLDNIPYEQDSSLKHEINARFSVELIKDLIIVNKTGYYYTFGEEHGMPLNEYVHIDLNNGNFYSLKDIFKEDSGYVDKLNEIIELQILQRMESNDAAISIEQFNGINPDQKFYITEDTLFIYLDTSESEPYTENFLVFPILFEEIKDLIEDNGTFWKAFND